MGVAADTSPVAAFCADLRRRWRASGRDLPSVAREVRISRAQLYAILNGEIKRPPSFDALVRPLIRACGGTDTELADWRRRHEVLVGVHTELRHGRVPRTSVSAQRPVDEGFAGGAAAPPRCLPRAPLRLVGRHTAVEETTASVRARVGTGQLQIVAIDGMAGVGKSALAAAIAQALGDCYPDAHLFIDLQGHSDQAPVTAYDALGVLLTQLRTTVQSIPESLPGRISLWRASLTDRRCIIVLDNAASAADVEHLLPDPSGSLVLVTSRRRLAPVHGAWSLSLEPLELDDAVDLLRDSADERIDREPSAAASVVELCGRLPLAIRLVGHRLRHRPRWTVAMMADQLRAAAPSPITVAAEGYSTAAAFDVSYRQLTSTERRLFRLLGLHPAGTFEAWPVAALAGLPIEDVRTMLDNLVEVHLVEEDVPGRYLMHDLLRAFAATLVAEAEGRTATLRMLDYYLQTATSANKHRQAIVVPEHPLLDADHLTRPFESDAERAAWMSASWATVATLADLAHRTSAHLHACLLPKVTLAFALVHGHSAAVVRLGQQALKSAEILGDDSLAALSHRVVAGLYLRLGQRDACRDHLEQAASRYRERGDSLNLGVVHVNIGVLCRYEGRLAEGLAHARIGEELASAGNDPSKMSYACLEAGTAARYLGLHHLALAYLRRAAAALRTRRSMIFASALSELGCVHLALGHPRVASLLLRHAITLKQRGHDIGGVAEAMSDYGRVQAAYGDPLEALRCQREAYERVQGLQDGFSEPAIGNDIGETLTVLGRYQEALAIHEEALSRAERDHRRYEQARAQAGIALARQHIDPAGADSARAIALTLFGTTGMGPDQALGMLARHPARMAQRS
jgi:tetratricopeptide (TPR) repeat protein